MEPYIYLAIITAGGTGLIIGILIGWYGCAERIRKNNQQMAQAMARSVGARPGQTKVEDMMSYDNRQRTTAPNNGEKARQGSVVFRPRRVARRR